jgi:hypothetical protein
MYGYYDSPAIQLEAAEEVEKLRAENERLRAEVAHRHLAHKAACEGGELLREEIKRLRTGLHHISLASQNSMSSKQECGRIARETLGGKS